jgi:hypothetical protein
MAIKKKFISGSPAEAIDGSKLLFSNDEAFRVKNASGVAEEIFKYDSSNVLKLLKVPQVAADPSAADDLVRKSFVDAQKEVLEGLISDEELARIAAISEEATARGAADDALDARLDIVEPKVSVLEGKVAVVEKDLSTEKAMIFENLASVYADGQPGIQDPQYRDGWYFKNAAAGQKINWYFYDGQAENVALGDMQSVYAIVTMDSVASLPIMAIYTTPTGSGDAQAWYKSRKVYSAPSGLVAGKKYLFHVGQAPAVHPELPKVQMVLSASSEGPQEASERVLTMAFNSNSGAAVDAVQWVVAGLGFESPAIRREISLRIRKASVAELAAEALARETADSALSVRASALESSVSVLNGPKTQAGSVDAKVDAAVQLLLGGVPPEALDTIKELATYIQSDEAAGVELAGKVGVLEAEMDAVEGRATSLESRMTTAEGDIDSVESRALSLEGRMTTAEGDIDGVQAGLISETAARIAEDNTFVKLDGSRLIEGTIGAQQNVSLGALKQFSGVSGTAGQTRVFMSQVPSFLYVNAFITGIGTSFPTKITAIGEGYFDIDKALTQTVTNVTWSLQCGFNLIQAATFNSISSNGTGYGSVGLGSSSVLPGGGNAFRLGALTSSYDVCVHSANSTGLTRNVRIESGNSTGNASGDIILQTGTASTVRGKISLQASELLLSGMQIKGLVDGVSSTDAATVGQLQSGVQESKDYADAAVADLVASAPAVLDTLKELADALGNDPAFATTVSGQIGDLDQRLDIIEGADTVEGSIKKAEKDAVSAAKVYTDAQFDQIAIPSYQFEKITLTAQDVTNGYIDVQAPIAGMCLVQSYNVLASRGSDYSFAGSRITFSGEWGAGGLSAIEEGQEVEVHYFTTIYPFA